MKKIKVSIPENPEFSNLMRKKFKRTVPKNEYNVFGYCRYMEHFAQWIMEQDEKQIVEHLAKVSCDAFNRLYKVMTEIEIKRALTQYELDRVMQTQAQCQTGAQNKEGENLQHLTAKGTALETPPV